MILRKRRERGGYKWNRRRGSRKGKTRESGGEEGLGLGLGMIIRNRFRGEGIELNRNCDKKSMKEK